MTQEEKTKVDKLSVGPEEVLHHLVAGDGDNLFVFAVSKEEAIKKVEGEFSADMVTVVVALPQITKALVEEGRRQVIGKIKEQGIWGRVPFGVVEKDETMWCLYEEEWQALEKELGGK